MTKQAVWSNINNMDSSFIVLEFWSTTFYQVLKLEQ